MENTPSKPSNVLLQAIVFIVLGAIIVWSFVWIKNIVARNKSGAHEVILRVEGTTSVAVVTYTKEDGVSTKPEEVHVPWQKTMIYNPKQVVVLTAANPMQMGMLSCVMLLDGKSWKKDTARSPADKISCAGIAP